MAAASPPPSPPSAKRPKMSSSSDPEADAEPTSPSAAAGAGADPGQPRRPRYKRRKVAILLGYCGAGYQGMQKNPGARTIEGDLEEALYQAGAVPEADRAALLPRLRAKPVRTASGIAVVAVMSKPHRCPHIATTGNICVYCPGGPDSDFEYSTQSYTGYEPTSMRAIRAR